MGHHASYRYSLLALQSVRVASAAIDTYHDTDVRHERLYDFPYSSHVLSVLRGLGELKNRTFDKTIASTNELIRKHGVVAGDVIWHSLKIQIGSGHRTMFLQKIINILMEPSDPQGLMVMLESAVRRLAVCRKIFVSVPRTSFKGGIWIVSKVAKCPGNFDWSRAIDTFQFFLVGVV